MCFLFISASVSAQSHTFFSFVRPAAEVISIVNSTRVNFTMEITSAIPGPACIYCKQDLHIVGVGAVSRRRRLQYIYIYIYTWHMAHAHTHTLHELRPPTAPPGPGLPSARSQGRSGLGPRPGAGQPWARCRRPGLM